MSTATTQNRSSSSRDRSGTTIDAYLGGLRRPLLTREDEIVVAKQIEAGERALLQALLATEEALNEVALLREDVREERVALAQVLRNVDQNRDAMKAQRGRLLRALATKQPRLVNRLVELRLHPGAFERLEHAVRLAGGHHDVLERATAARKQIDSAKVLLVESNLRLVVSFARRYQSEHLALLDLIQEGNVGLMRAVDKFDYRCGYRLSTYAGWWIKQAIERAITDRAPTIRVPVHLIESRTKIRRARHQLRRELGGEPTTEQVANKAGLPVAKVELILGLAREPMSLEAPIRSDGETTIGELIVNNTSTLPEDEVGKARLRRNAHTLLGELEGREREILIMRFGLDGAPERTLEEIGATMSLTRERIRQIEAAALRRLRARCEAQCFYPEIAS